jgi:hypothetical protein
MEVEMAEREMLLLAAAAAAASTDDDPQQQQQQPLPEGWERVEDPGGHGIFYVE